MSSIGISDPLSCDLSLSLVAFLMIGTIMDIRIKKMYIQVSKSICFCKLALLYERCLALRLDKNRAIFTKTKN